MTWLRRTNVAALAATLALAGCGAATEEELFEEDEVDDLDLFASSGKTDTGYVSDQAAELNAELKGTIILDLTAQIPSEKTRLVEAARAQNKAAFGNFPVEQIKYGRNALKAAKFNASMESVPATITRLALTSSDTRIELDYVVSVESLVKNKDLPAGTTIASLVGKKLTLKLPADPRTAFTKGGIKCATDPDVPATPDSETLAEINDQNYFFYWDAAKTGCACPTATVTFEVKNEAAAKTTYPEFDKLLADNKITLVALFGQLEHGELLDGTQASGDYDWGWIGYEDFTEWLRAQGYKETLRVPARAELTKQSSSTWTKKYSTKLTVVVDVISPLDLQDHADAVKKDGLLKTAIQTHELVYYNGHSFYGSLKVLDDPSNFASGYQVVFMDSCWSYAYYTKQVFAAKATTADPAGMLNADVINNTEPGISGSHETYAIFLKKFFVAANYVAKNEKSKAKNYNWKNLISYMNTSAKKRAETSAREGDVHDPEIYGASGVTKNVWKP